MLLLTVSCGHIGKNGMVFLDVRIMSLPISYIGIAAGVFTGTSMLPQLVKTIRERNADGISAGMLTVLMIGLALWVWYGVEKEDWPIIVTNAFSFFVNLAISVLRLSYRGRS